MSVPRGVTPTLEFTFDDENLDLTSANHVYVTFRGGKSFTKSDEDLTIEAKKISVYLNQSETLSFMAGPVEIQANWTYPNGRRAASTIVSYVFDKQLLNQVVE